MNPQGHLSESRLDQAIGNYTTTLGALEEAAPTASLEQVIAVLVARDAVESIRQTTDDATSSNLAQVILLDQRLKAQSKTLAETASLSDCRQSMQPAESAWWWWLEPPPPQEPWFSRFDWFWNLLTVGCLVVAGTFSTTTAQAFSTSGFDLLGTFSTITQGAGLVLVAGGALTEKGQKVVEKVCSSLKIPTWLHAEATFVLAGLLLAASYNIHSNLPKFGNYYYQQGQNAEADDAWLVAQDNYERALQFIPGDAKVQVSLGKIYERLGNLEDAEKAYQNGALANDMEARIRLGRVNLLQALQAARWTGKVAAKEQGKLRTAEIYLEMADNNLNAPPKGGDQDKQASLQNNQIMKELYINQGILRWAKAGLDAPDNLAKNELLDEAEALFKKAADLEYGLPTVATGRTADCYHNIARYINTRLKTKGHQTSTDDDVTQAKQEAEYCSDSSGEANRDLYDALLMSRAMKAKLGKSKN